MHKRLGITTLFVTHDQEEAMTICDRIAVLDQGVIQQIGTPVELFDRPANRFVAQFVGSVNFLGEASFRPHAVRILEGGEPAPGDGLHLEGVIESGEFLGEFVRYAIRVNEHVVTADQAHRRGAQPLPAGHAVRLFVPRNEIRNIAP